MKINSVKTVYRTAGGLYQAAGTVWLAGSLLSKIFPHLLCSQSITLYSVQVSFLSGLPKGGHGQWDLLCYSVGEEFYHWSWLERKYWFMVIRKNELPVLVHYITAQKMFLKVKSPPPPPLPEPGQVAPLVWLTGTYNWLQLTKVCFPCDTSSLLAWVPTETRDEVGTVLLGADSRK